ncbi:MAG: hypothetical protein HYR63_04025 [Proteobacteria bacterium]|nr:hypothetical protein [Pseudomonadota bacterium]MBI3498627.1 hypothetical protein [Pseudomonadota bacterium]
MPADMIDASHGESRGAKSGLIPPDPMSDACARFFRSHVELWRFIGFVSDLALRVDDMARIAADALPPGVSGRPAGGANSAPEGAMARGLRAQRHVFLHMVLARAVDNYLVYLAELMSALFVNSPQALAAAEQVTLATVLEHDTIEELVEDLAQERVGELGRQGVDALERYLADRFGFQLFLADGELDRAIRLTETRRLIVHHRGCVTRRFLNRLPNQLYKLGQPLELAIDQVFEDCSFLAASVADIDVRAADQFDLSRPITGTLPIG